MVTEEKNTDREQGLTILIQAETLVLEKVHEVLQIGETRLKITAEERDPRRFRCHKNVHLRAECTFSQESEKEVSESLESRRNQQQHQQHQQRPQQAAEAITKRKGRDGQR